MGRSETLPGLAIAWLLAEPMVSSVITGVSKVEQVLANARAAERKLDRDELTEFHQILGVR